MKNTARRSAALGVGLALLLTSALVGCEGKKEVPTIKIDGSSTVYPIMLATVEMYGKKGINVTSSGTGGGFKKFYEKEPSLRTDINDASRTVKPSEVATMKKLGVEFIELPIAYDGVAVVVNKANTFCDSLTTAELKLIWNVQDEGNPIKTWNQVRPEWPAEPINLYGPTGDHGTFEYFTEAINGKARSCRSDYNASAATPQIVQGVMGDPNGLGFFGYSYYKQSAADLKLLSIDNGDGKPITPTPETIGSLAYTPLSRPLFIYVNKLAAQRPEVKAYISFFFEHAKEIVEHDKVGYVALTPDLYAKSRERFDKLITGTVYADEESHKKSLYEHYGLSK